MVVAPTTPVPSAANVAESNSNSAQASSINHQRSQGNTGSDTTSPFDGSSQNTQREVPIPVMGTRGFKLNASGATLHSCFCTPLTSLIADAKLQLKHVAKKIAGSSTFKIAQSTFFTGNKIPAVGSVQAEDSIYCPVARESTDMKSVMRWRCMLMCSRDKVIRPCWSTFSLIMLQDGDGEPRKIASKQDISGVQRHCAEWQHYSNYYAKFPISDADKRTFINSTLLKMASFEGKKAMEKEATEQCHVNIQPLLQV